MARVKPAAIGLWYIEPWPKVTKAPEKEKKVSAAATLLSTGAGGKGLPILLDQDQITGKESFLSREMKFARRWLYSKGVMVPEETRNPVDVQLEAFFDSCRTGKRPVADLEIGLADSIAVMLANQSMDEGRRVYFNEIEKMGRGEVKSEAKADKKA